MDKNFEEKSAEWHDGVDSNFIKPIELLYSSDKDIKELPITKTMYSRVEDRSNDDEKSGELDPKAVSES